MPSDPADIYNIIEPFIWLGVAVISTIALRRYATSVQRLTLGLLLVVFGLSDLFETDAWWTPWWLLTWKLAAGTGVVVTAILIWRNHRCGTAKRRD